ncbi:MAG: TIR domain-containing protein [Burkholderiales bacterium]|nr:TIR domain-containing protein [Burkholderiales bacterium]
MAENRKHVFISHIHEDDQRLAPLRSLLQRAGMEIRDGSIHSGKPNEAKSVDYIKSSILRPQIEWASVLVVLISPGTKDSDWVTWEIECAERLGKRIVGVWDHGEAQTDMPAALERYADAVVGWQGERVRDAIEGKINDRENPDGGLPPPRATPRYTC